MLLDEFLSKTKRWHGILECAAIAKLVDVAGLENLYLAINCWVVVQLRCNPDIATRIEEIAVVWVQKCDSGSPGVAWRVASNEQHDDTGKTIESAVEKILKATSIHMLIEWLSVLPIDWSAMHQRLATRKDFE